MSGIREDVPSFGVVVIGRNEGERLRRCLDSVMCLSAAIVYVDSGSTDNSVAMARNRGVAVVGLDLSVPFTAARARNAGFARLMEVDPSISYVQFVDGDCELSRSWLQTATHYLDENRGVACVCGRLRERFPERSIYNTLCDLEWDRPEGDVPACGGIAMFRCSTFSAVGGFRQALIAGEESELCLRIRRHGGRIRKIGSDMAWHDAALLRFGQWWKRAQRGGHAFAEGAQLHGGGPERHGVREAGRALAWGAVLPAVIVGLGLVDARWLALTLIYPLQVLRLAGRYGIANRVGWSRALLMVLARFAEASGVLKFYANRLFRRRSALIEYK